MNLQRIAARFTFSVSIGAAVATSLAWSLPTTAASTPTAAAPAVEAIYDPTRPAPATEPKKPLPPDTTAPAEVTPAIPLPAPSASPLKRVGPAPLPSRTKSFLWEAKSATGSVYLFGTIHVGKRAFFPLPDQVERAFDQSTTLVVEADVSAPPTNDLNTLINYVPPDTLDKNIPKPLFDRLRAQLLRLRIPDDAVKTMRPYVVGGLLSVVEYSRLGYDMTQGVDSYLLARAKETGKPVEELESVRAQLEMLGAMPPRLQEAFLDNAVTTLELGRSADQVTGMVNAWQTGDAKLMADVSEAVNKDMKSSAELDEIMLGERHVGMMKKIEAYLAGKTPVFVAVGSLHLVGPRGLIQLLKAKGYEVEQK